jgi:predicted deacetylase
MRQRREEFKNRAKQAELRLKKQDEELDEAPSSPSSER